jgi:DNA-binding Lrp family transcriptional regulator
MKKVHKGSQKVHKKVHFKRTKPKITQAEKEVLHYLTKEYLTPKKIAIRRQTTPRAVYKIIQKLKSKGIINKVHKIVGTIEPSEPNKIRLHGEEFNIKILYKDNRYKELTKKTNLQIIDGNTVKLYRNSIKIYSGQSFYADSPDKALYNSIPYWNRFLTRLEHDLKVILVKSRYQNIKIVKVHFAEINNEIAKDYEVSGDKLRLYAREDGKLWLQIDNSFNLHEMETQHPETAKQDMIKVRKQVNDWRENNPPTLSEVMRVIKESVNVNRETAAGLSAAIKLLFPQEKKELIEKDFEKSDYIG